MILTPGGDSSSYHCARWAVSSIAFVRNGPRFWHTLPAPNWYAPCNLCSVPKRLRLENVRASLKTDCSLSIWPGSAGFFVRNC